MDDCISEHIYHVLSVHYADYTTQWSLAFQRTHAIQQHTVSLFLCRAYLLLFTFACWFFSFISIKIWKISHEWHAVCYVSLCAVLLK